MSIIGWKKELLKGKISEKKYNRLIPRLRQWKVTSTMYFINIVLWYCTIDSVKVSDSEEVSDQDTGSNVVECEETFCVVF